MLDELFDALTDRERDRSRRSHGSSGGLLGKIGQLLEGDAGEDRRYADDRYDDSDRRRGERRDYGHDDDRDDDHWSDRRGRKRRGFDFDFGDD